jgi:hypothetical protein
MVSVAGSDRGGGTKVILIRASPLRIQVLYYTVNRNKSETIEEVVDTFQLMRGQIPLRLVKNGWKLQLLLLFSSGWFMWLVVVRVWQFHM